MRMFRQYAAERCPGCGWKGSDRVNKRKAVWAWMLFDWANQPWYTLIVTYVFGHYFVSRVAADPVHGQAVWGYCSRQVRRRSWQAAHHPGDDAPDVGILALDCGKGTGGQLTFDCRDDDGTRAWRARTVDDQGVAGQDPVFGHAATLGRDEERRRWTLYEMVVEVKARCRGNYGEHQAMPVNFPCCRQRRSTWFGGKIHPAHRLKLNDVKRETATWRVTAAISYTKAGPRYSIRRLEMRGLINGYR